MSSIAIIGGTGVYDPNMFETMTESSLMTPYGEIHYVYGTYEGKTVYFLARHGRDHSIPPHKINYRANIWGLKKLGVKYIVSRFFGSKLWTWSFCVDGPIFRLY